MNPALRQGVLAFVRRERVNGRPALRLRLGTLTGRSSRVLARSPVGTPVGAVALTGPRTVVYSTHVSPPDRNVWTLRVAHPGRRTRVLDTLRSGFNSNSGYSSITAVDGGHVAVARWRSLNFAADLLAYDIRTGRRRALLTDQDDYALVPTGPATYTGFGSF